MKQTENTIQSCSLSEAKSTKENSLILSYTGGSWTNLNGNYKVTYPTGWHFFRVFNEVSISEALAVIEAEQARLNRLNEYLRINLKTKK
ncbi:hypothetical protein [Cytobacillus praedii]|uniref:hypothetical protein n=1 Tax=Cytobacillus praedii TaxID=1742358 RepID=UPI002E20A54C|nr:hypothetical protein [Cytobacillus praedii]